MKVNVEREVLVKKSVKANIDWSELTDSEVARLRLMYIKNVYRGLGLREVPDSEYKKVKADIVYFDPQTKHYLVFFTRQGLVRSYNEHNRGDMPHRLLDGEKVRSLSELMSKAVGKIVIARFHSDRPELLNKRFISDVLLNNEERVEKVLISDEEKERREYENKTWSWKPRQYDN